MVQRDKAPDGIRAIAVVHAMPTHYCISARRLAWPEVVTPTGRCRVDRFFLLSGCLVTGPESRRMIEPRGLLWQQNESISTGILSSVSRDPTR
jgi:peptidoglycan/LPS O-acetylase OafA/YrhL